MLHLIVVGGASGVGKSSLLGVAQDIPQLNTGNLFKNYMALQDRDDVRTGDWSMVEGEVALDLASSVKAEFGKTKTVMIDTHFAAKIHNKRYRIGMKKPLVAHVAKETFAYGDEIGEKVHVSVVLVRCWIHSLLRRRRLDTSRKRELVPSDCSKGLRENDFCSWHYFHQFLNASQTGDLGVTYQIIENGLFERAQVILKQIVNRGA